MLISVVLVAVTSIVSQTVSGYVFSADSRKPLVGSLVSIFAGDSLTAIGETNKDGLFLLATPDNGINSLVVTAMGYKDYEMDFRPDTISQTMRLYLNKDSKEINLSEIIVTADRSKSVKRTANGQIFYLSSKAKKLSNPFMAMQEIPLLKSDHVNSTIPLIGDKKTLVLINGNPMAKVDPILPKNIESVEVINVVPARYLQEGYEGIINIKLKPDAAPYLWIQGATRHDIPLGHGLGVGYFEIGNTKYSLVGRASADYTLHRDINSSIYRENSGYSQNYSSSQRTNSHHQVGELLFKWSPGPKDFFAVDVQFDHDKSKGREHGAGEFTESVPKSYSFNGNNHNKGTILTSSAYYKHDFAPANTVEIKGFFNHNGNNLDSYRDELLGERPESSILILKNSRNSGNLDIDYSKSFESGKSMSLGSHTTGQFDKIDQISSGYPIFRHRQINEYLFGSLSGMFKKIYYMASAGIEMIWLKAGNVNNSYVRPRASLSGTWSINQNNSFLLGYTLSNQSPEIAKLNPYDTSTDPLIVESGNPYLTPQTTHKVTAEYTFNRGNLYLTPSVRFYAVTDVIEPGGYTENGIYHSLYVNAGRNTALSYSAYLYYNLGFGSIGVGTSYIDNYYEGCPARGSFSAGIDFNARVNKFTFNAGINFNSRRVSPTSITKYYRPEYAQLQVTYNFTPDFYISMALQDATGEYRNRTTVNNGSYRSIITSRFDYRNMRPWILLRYTFRKNQHKKMNLNNNILQTKEKGINLKE